MWFLGLFMHLLLYTILYCVYAVGYIYVLKPACGLDLPVRTCWMSSVNFPQNIYCNKWDWCLTQVPLPSGSRAKEYCFSVISKSNKCQEFSQHSQTLLSQMHLQQRWFWQQLYKFLNVHTTTARWRKYTTVNYDRWVYFIVLSFFTADIWCYAFYF